MLGLEGNIYNVRSSSFRYRWERREGGETCRNGDITAAGECNDGGVAICVSSVRQSITQTVVGSAGLLVRWGVVDVGECDNERCYEWAGMVEGYES